MDLDQLTDEQKDKLRQFQDISNLEDIDLATVTLASCDWNLETAIEAHLGGAPVVRGPSLGISAMDYVRDFDEQPMMVDQEDEDGGPVLPPHRYFGGRAEAARAAAEEEEAIAAAVSASRAAADEEDAIAAAIAASATSSATSSVSTCPTDSQREQRAGAGRSSRTTAAAASAAATPTATAAEPVARPAAAAAMDYSEDSDEDYDYAMEEQDEAPVARVASSSNGGASRANDFGLPLIPTDCASALEGTQNFQSVFEARYGKDGRGHLMPPFFIGSMQAAIREAFDCPDRPVSERRPLALYIHHDGSVARNIFPQAVLCSDQVLQLLRSQFVVWPWDVTAKENEEKLVGWLSDCSLYDARPIVASFLKNIDRFPVLILLSKDGGQLRMIDFVNGSESADQAMEKLLMCMDAYASSKISLEKQEQERFERESLRKEQERELQESLAVDKEKAEKKAREIREAKEAEEQAKKEKEEKEAHIAALKASLPDEPAADAPDCCQVRFRLPEQGNALRRFSKTSPLSVVLTFLESEGFPVKDYRMMNSEFPQKKDISEWDAKSTLADLKIPTREVINVEER
ncbi:hypothetical protein PENTCL1PPCAC_5448 [Pristionchus entomophagus]|uniref:UBX domain-containing protein n=1 Tax=Pristionchus entomophagus TaxID=358040 RepID=A0AAV5SMC9_9BILA|nr:hypothetical protein PENTCL1PPCAC_5448 [Pristionchus entomophagus]